MTEYRINKAGKPQKGVWTHDLKWARSCAKEASRECKMEIRRKQGERYYLLEVWEGGKKA